MGQLLREAYEKTWEMRRKPPVVAEGWTKWAKGRTDYLTFLIRVDDPELVKKIIELQEALHGLDCLDFFLPHYFHLTVKEVSCFLVNEKKEDDELTYQQLEALISSAEDKLKNNHSFNVELKNVNHFRSNIVVEAHDDGFIREMNKKLLKVKGVKKLPYDYPKFLPHLSVCQFNSSDNHDEVVNRLETLRPFKVGEMRVQKIDLVKVILQPSKNSPLFETIRSFDLI